VPDATEETESAADPKGNAGTLDDEEMSEWLLTEALPPPADSQDEAAPTGKRRRSEVDEDSSNSNSSPPIFVEPISSASPAQPSLFDMAQDLST
jgi:hypothetical protein